MDLTYLLHNYYLEEIFDNPNTWEDYIEDEEEEEEEEEEDE